MKVVKALLKMVLVVALMILSPFIAMGIMTLAAAAGAVLPVVGLICLVCLPATIVGVIVGCRQK